MICTSVQSKYIDKKTFHRVHRRMYPVPFCKFQFIEQFKLQSTGFHVAKRLCTISRCTHFIIGRKCEPQKRKCVPGGGSDGSAACGGNSDLSEWPRSACNAGVRAKAHAGHRNGIWGGGLPCGSKALNSLPSRILWVLSWRDKKVPPPAGTGSIVVLSGCIQKENPRLLVYNWLSAGLLAGFLRRVSFLFRQERHERTDIGEALCVLLPQSKPPSLRILPAASP